MSSTTAPSIPYSSSPGKDPPPPPSHHEPNTSVTKQEEGIPPLPQPTIKRQATTHTPSAILHSPNPSSALPYSESTSYTTHQTGGMHSEMTNTTQAGGQNSGMRDRPTFNPLFTLVHDVKEDAGGRGGREGEVIHPKRVIYLFSDDEGGELVDGVLGSLSTQHSPLPIHHRPSSSGTEYQERGGDRDRDKERTMQARDAGRETAEREERVVIVDLNETADTVLQVNSLSEKWQVLSATLENAPSWDGSAGDSEERGEGLMLRIEGVGVDGLVGDVGEGLGVRGGGMGESGGMGEEELQGILEGFDRKMAVLRRVVGDGAGVVGAGEERRRKESAES